MSSDHEIISRWSRSAPFWEKHREVIRQMFAPVTEALVEDAQVGPQQAVLDVATGPGEPALSLTQLVGQEGHVFGIDPSPEMVAGARRAAARLGLKNVQFEVASADHLPFPADTFEAVASRFGAMFFPFPLDAVREMLRVLKPGGRMALAVWHFAERNPFHFSLSRVMDRYANSPLPEPDALDAFRFAPAGKLREVLSRAGVRAPSERLLQFNIDAPISVEDFWTLRLGMSERLREKLAMLSPKQTAEAHREALESLGEFSTSQGMSFPAEVLIVSGAKTPPA